MKNKTEVNNDVTQRISTYIVVAFPVRLVAARFGVKDFPWFLVATTRRCFFASRYCRADSSTLGQRLLAKESASTLRRTTELQATAFHSTEKEFLRIQKFSNRHTVDTSF